MTATVDTIGPVGKGALASLANDPNVEHFAIVYKDRTVSAGWSDGIKHMDLVYAVQSLAFDANEQAFRGGHDDD